MPRERTGCVRVRTIKDEKGRKRELIYARVTYTDLSGKRKTVERRAESRSHAKDLNREIIREIEQKGTRGIEAHNMTFAQLADWFTKQYLVPAKYVGDRKVSGSRTHVESIRLKNVLVANFGAARLRDITHADLERYKQKRLDTPTIHDKQRSIRAVNIELSLLRRMLNVAQREGWIIKNPFNTGDSLISAADEVKRQRILTKDEEDRLLSVCTGRRAHLRPILICALDTGMRRGEMFSLKWSDVDLVSRTIHIQAFNTKTLRERTVPMSSRVERELKEMFAANSPKQSDLVFGIEETIKRSFATACRLAGITGFRLHDARHSCATRWIQGGMPIASVARLLGHESITTTYRYVNATPDASAQAVEILNRFNEDSQHKVN